MIALVFDGLAEALRVDELLLHLLVQLVECNTQVVGVIGCMPCAEIWIVSRFAGSFGSGELGSGPIGDVAGVVSEKPAPDST